MSRLGLTMHVGKGEKASKTEAFFFPSRTKMQSWIDKHEKSLISDINLPLDISKKKCKTPLKNMKVITDRFYMKAKETQQLILKDLSFIPFIRNFKYLGSWISYDLTDSSDILSRIKKLTKRWELLNSSGKQKKLTENQNTLFIWLYL